MSEIKYPVSEIFDSIDGEGIRTGYMAIFVRLAGCNLRCTYCDTEYALQEEQADEWLTTAEIMARLSVFPWKRLTLTGGEPLIHRVEPLVGAMCEAGYEVNIETNGAVPLAEQRPERCFYTMDYKTGSSGMREQMRLQNFALLLPRDVVKFVVGSRDDLREMKKIVSEFYPPAARNAAPSIFVSPVWGKIEPAEIVAFLRDNRLDNVRLQIQLHKIIWAPEARGV